MNLIEFHETTKRGSHLVWTLHYCGFNVRTKWFNFDKYNFIFLGFAFSYGPQNAEYYHKNGGKFAPEWYKKPIFTFTSAK